MDLAGAYAYASEVMTQNMLAQTPPGHRRLHRKAPAGVERCLSYIPEAGSRRAGARI